MYSDWLLLSFDFWFLPSLWAGSPSFFLREELARRIISPANYKQPEKLHFPLPLHVPWTQIPAIPFEMLLYLGNFPLIKCRKSTYCTTVCTTWSRVPLWVGHFTRAVHVHSANYAVLVSRSVVVEEQREFRFKNTTTCTTHCSAWFHQQSSRKRSKISLCGLTILSANLYQA